MHLAASFQLKGSHGYSVHVLAHRAPTLALLAKPHHRVGKVTVTVRKTIESASAAEVGSAFYAVPARFNKHRLRANLGSFGEVRLRFHKHPGFLLGPPPAAAQKRRIASCQQFGFYVPGRFRGVFRFRGEGGYTRARSHRLHGRLRRDGPAECSGHDHGIELKARSGATAFSAFQDNDYGLTFLSAHTRERTGRVEIVRQSSRLVAADAGEFTFDQALTSAHVIPVDGLFTGSAEYASPGDWTGSLSVSFPGQADVPLTGPGYAASLDSGKFPARPRTSR